MSYVSGFVLAVPTAKRDAYRAHAEAAWPIFRDLGCIGLRECWGADVPDGKLTSFPMAVKKEGDETVVFSWMEWPDRETADRAFKVMESDQRLQALGEMPFDGKRMIWGGFEPIVDQRADAA
jgi:uncharacterized protein YbaA (DUF1428 family)